MTPPVLTIQQYKDLLERMVATWDNLLAAEGTGDRASVEKLRSGLRRIMERAREATRADA
jgi:ElaB/YqjD/DUF883 family membrane-anchored ribosome-binding protein